MAATSTPYASGMKKPLNMLENPVYPDIKKGPPRFVWSRKHWNVDVGATLRDTEPFTQFVEPAILTQSRNYNQTVYGQSSHRDIVNAEFRPPLLSPYEDLGPLSRIPATIHAIIPHINPTTAGHDGGTSGYEARNERASDVAGALTDRIKTREWRPTFYAPMEIPADNSVLPDLEAKLPPISVHAGWNVPVYISPQPQEPDLQERLYVPIHSGNVSSVTVDGPTGLENFETYNNRPVYSASAGMNIPVQITEPFYVSREFDYNRPQVSVSAGINTPAQFDSETRVEELFYNRPQVSVSAGMNNPVQFDAETRVEELMTKLEGNLRLSVLNPGAEDGYRTQTETPLDQDKNIRDNRPMFSYVVPSEEPIFRTQNEQTHQPHFRRRLQVPKSYGQISQSGGAIPRFGVEQPRTSLGGGRTYEKMVPKRKQVQYHF